jgi:hypothetical protein
MDDFSFAGDQFATGNSDTGAPIFTDGFGNPAGTDYVQTQGGNPATTPHFNNSLLPDPVIPQNQGPLAQNPIYQDVINQDARRMDGLSYTDGQGAVRQAAQPSFFDDIVGGISDAAAKIKDSLPDLPDFGGNFSAISKLALVAISIIGIAYILHKAD